MSLLSQALSTLPLIILICVAFTSILFLKVLLRYGHHCQSTQTLAVKHRRYPEGPLCLFDHNVVGPHQCGKSDLTLNSASLSVSAVYPQFVTPVLLLVPLDYHSLVEMGYLFSSFAALCFLLSCLKALIVIRRITGEHSVSLWFRSASESLHVLKAVICYSFFSFRIFMFKNNNSEYLQKL